jgi:hypothetical protein
MLVMTYLDEFVFLKGARESAFVFTGLEGLTADVSSQFCARYVLVRRNGAKLFETALFGPSGGRL